MQMNEMQFLKSKSQQFNLFDYKILNSVIVKYQTMILSAIKQNDYKKLDFIYNIISIH